MNVLIIGSGGREHALALKIKQSPDLNNLFVMPGNPGTSFLGSNIEIEPANQSEVVKFCKESEIELVIIGPEQPLVDGLTDTLKQHKINVFGPSKDAAQIEASKSFAKGIMDEAEVRFPFDGMVEFTDPELDNKMVIDADSFRRDYLEEVDSFRTQFKKDCYRTGIDYVPLDTSMQFDRALVEYLHSRQNRG